MVLSMEKKQSEGKWRFERKFMLSASEYIQFEKLLLLSDLQELYAKRSINNCYLDDVKHSAFTESIEGYAEKTKTRLRWYGNFFSKTTPTLEFKLKQNNSNRKELFKLYDTDIHEEINWFDYTYDLRQYVLDKHKFSVSERLKPVLLNSYDRYYYTNFEKSFRLTVDENLRFSSPIGVFRNQQPYRIDKYIVELKFNNDKNINSFSILKNLGKFSKFTTGISLIN